MTSTVKLSILAASLIGATVFTSSADAAVIATADLSLPLFPAAPSTTAVGVQGGGTPSQSTYTGSGYTISFNVPGDQGIVQGSVPSSIHAVPVAGVTPGGAPTYLTGDYGSTQTSDPLLSGNYLSTGAGSITVTFDRPEISLGLLWGSIDTSNRVTFDNGDTLTGAQIQALAFGFAGNGYQGPGGSAYVLAIESNPFTSVTFSSDVTSFELASVVASVEKISPVPLPASAPMFGAALLGLAGLGYVAKRKKAAAAV